MKFDSLSFLALTACLLTWCRHLALTVIAFIALIEWERSQEVWLNEVEEQQDYLALAG